MAVGFVARNGGGPPVQREAALTSTNGPEGSHSLNPMIRGNRAMRVAVAAVSPRVLLANQHVSGHIMSLTASPPVMVAGVMFLTLIFCFVVLPAIWSRDPARRTAAYSVLDLILRFLRR
jgi:hypothetical protein